MEQENTRFANDLSDELKARVIEASAKRISDLLGAESFSMNELAVLAGVNRGSVKCRAKTLTSASEIVTYILDGVRAGGSKKKPSTEAVKSLLDSMSAEEKANFLAELGITA